MKSILDFVMMMQENLDIDVAVQHCMVCVGISTHGGVTEKLLFASVKG